ncbi:alpha/beta fold hydrolase [Cystobacter ferrugineus]|uniref:Alpha/beta hydrolase n=1 Tax=Cystobacter ferrugineus TaxID=83449 RepID=A0A1L9AZI2_9BACT|nr:alpha/beta fold hydrolase [Cystobacter ferrugineus]OJH35386.1 alpha/beta hydrolase [Cystobacter ferrugineus]
MDLISGLQEVSRRLLVMRGVRSEEVVVGGQRLHHFTLKGSGKGPPIVLVHGLGGAASGFGRVLFPLAKRFERVFAVDLPGHGFSPEYCLGPMCVRGQYEMLVRYCREVVGAPAFVVGNSLGGAMSVQLAAEHPELVRALALVASAGADVGHELIREVLESMNVRTGEQARALTQRLFHRPPWAMMFFANALRGIYGTPAVRALSADVISTGEYLKPEQLQGLTMPVLFVWGANEKLLPRESLDFFRTHLPPHSQVRVVDGFGHLPHVERPGELVSELLQFADSAGL